MKLIRPVLFTLLFIGFTQALKVFLLIVLGFDLFDYYFLSYGLILLISILLFIYSNKGNKLKLPQSVDIKWYLITLGIFVGLIILRITISWIYILVTHESNTNIVLYSGFSRILSLNNLSFLVFIPIANELFFRGFIQKNLHKHTRPIVAIFISSLLFAAVPYSELIIAGLYLEFYKPLFTFLAGLVLGTLYYKSKSLGPSVLLHILTMTSLMV